MVKFSLQTFISASTSLPANILYLLFLFMIQNKLFEDDCDEINCLELFLLFKFFDPETFKIFMVSLSRNRLLSPTHYNTCFDNLDEEKKQTVIQFFISYSRLLHVPKSPEILLTKIQQFIACGQIRPTILSSFRTMGQKENHIILDQQEISTLCDEFIQKVLHKIRSEETPDQINRIINGKQKITQVDVMKELPNRIPSELYYLGKKLRPHEILQDEEYIEIGFQHINADREQRHTIMSRLIITIFITMVYAAIDQSVPVFYKCNKCDHISIKLLLCAKCKCTRYCSPDCQKQDWRNHKVICRPIGS